MRGRHCSAAWPAVAANIIAASKILAAASLAIIRILDSPSTAAAAVGTANAILDAQFQRLDATLLEARLRASIAGAARTGGLYGPNREWHCRKMPSHLSPRVRCFRCDVGCGRHRELFHCAEATEVSAAGGNGNKYRLHFNAPSDHEHLSHQSDPGTCCFAPNICSSLPSLAELTQPRRAPTNGHCDNQCSRPCWSVVEGLRHARRRLAVCG